MVIVHGNTNQPLSCDIEMLKKLQTACQKNNWPIREYQADTSNSVVTRTGKYMKKDDYDAKANVEAKNLAKTRCCIIL